MYPSPRDKRRGNRYALAQCHLQPPCAGVGVLESDSAGLLSCCLPAPRGTEDTPISVWLFGTGMSPVDIR